MWDDMDDDNEYIDIIIRNEIKLIDAADANGSTILVVTCWLVWSQE